MLATALNAIVQILRRQRAHSTVRACRTAAYEYQKPLRTEYHHVLHWGSAPVRLSSKTSGGTIFAGLIADRRYRDVHGVLRLRVPVAQFTAHWDTPLTCICAKPVALKLTHTGHLQRTSLTRRILDHERPIKFCCTRRPSSDIDSVEHQAHNYRTFIVVRSLSCRGEGEPSLTSDFRKCFSDLVPVKTRKFVRVFIVPVDRFVHRAPTGTCSPISWRKHRVCVANKLKTFAFN